GGATSTSGVSESGAWRPGRIRLVAPQRMYMKQTWQAVIGMSLLLGGCFDPSYQEGIACSEARTCPAGFACGPDDRCWREIVPRCDDGVQSGDETGVDCG